MKTKKYTLWIEAEHWAPEEWDVFDDNTDVIVNFDDDSSWTASFFTYKNIETLTKKNAITGECMDGKYFWASNMVLVDEVSRNRIIQVIDQLINEERFELVFSQAGRMGEV